MTQEERDYELAILRITNSAQHVGRMIWIITVVAGGISLLVVLSVVIIAIVGLMRGISENVVPDVLSNWGGIILGFYFGQFITLVKDFMGIVGGSSPQALSGTPTQRHG